VTVCGYTAGVPSRRVKVEPGTQKAWRVPTQLSRASTCSASATPLQGAPGSTVAESAPADAGR
jgi:hypothetical protein